MNFFSVLLCYNKMGDMMIKLFNLSKKSTFNLLILIMIISSVLGFVYEEIFYYIDLGYLVKRGSTFGPWIPIYLFGGLFISLIAYPFRKKPLLVFILSLLVTGVLEYLTGFILYHVFNIRLWDYNTEILNFGNINGYICFRSVLLFGICGLLLVYCIIPFLYKILEKVDEKVMHYICLILISLFIIDVCIYWLLKI